MSNAAQARGVRLARIAADEHQVLLRHLARARDGDDGALHKARKTLQRLRALVRLLEPVDPELATRENIRLRRFRQRLAPLRDAAARRATFHALASRVRWKPHALALRELAAAENLRHRDAWLAHPSDAPFWSSVEREAARIGLRIAQWPLHRVDAAAISTVLEDSEKKARKRVRAARGGHGREARHELRRKLRRHANLCRVAAQAREEDDTAAERLLGLAKRCGLEGDLWMAVVSARRGARSNAALREVVKALEAERRAMCARHDRLLQRSLARR